VTRVLDFGNCPPQSTVHVISQPILIIIIHCISHTFTRLCMPLLLHTFCSWLQHSLVIHCIRCLRCVSLDPHVAVVFDGVSLFIAVDGLQQTFSLSHFESETYTHCSVFHRFTAARAHLLPTVAFLAASTQHNDPPWFYYEYEQYHNSLQTLSARHLVSVALTLVSRKSSCRTKKHVTEVILTHFFSRCTELSVMKVLSLQLSNPSLPIRSILTRGTLIACDTTRRCVDVISWSFKSDCSRTAKYRIFVFHRNPDVYTPVPRNRQLKV